MAYGEGNLGEADFAPDFRITKVFPASPYPGGGKGWKWVTRNSLPNNPGKRTLWSLAQDKYCNRVGEIPRYMLGVIHKHGHREDFGSKITSRGKRIIRPTKRRPDKEEYSQTIGRIITTKRSSKSYITPNKVMMVLQWTVGYLNNPTVEQFVVITKIVKKKKISPG